MTCVLEIKISLMDWEPGDGSYCHQCGDPAWLRQRRLVAITSTNGKRQAECTVAVFCQSCGDMEASDLL